MVMPVAAPIRPDPSRRYTVEDVLAWPPDGHRYEVVHGELLVTPGPAPRHQVVVTSLLLALGEYLRNVGLSGTLLTGPVDYFHGTEVFVQPDLVVVYREELTADYRTLRRLRLAVEVLSPSSRRGDRLVKRRAYQDAGVETYWAVDPDHGVVEVWHPGDELAELATRELVWRVTPEAPELRVDLTALFANLP
jgi:Uma2 family endonuclease